MAGAGLWLADGSSEGRGGELGRYGLWESEFSGAKWDQGCSFFLLLFFFFTCSPSLSFFFSFVKHLRSRRPRPYSQKLTHILVLRGLLFNSALGGARVALSFTSGGHSEALAHFVRALLRRATREYDIALNTHLVAQLCQNGVGWFIQLETQLWPGSRGSEWGRSVGQYW